MDKLTREEVAKVFAMYLGCTIVHEDNETAQLRGIINATAHFIHDGTGSYGHQACDECGKLLLKPLSEISDEDAIEVAHMLYYHPTNNSREFLVLAGNDYIEDTGVWNMKWRIREYLISKSYAVPLFFAPNHPCNGMDAIQLGLALPHTNN